MADIVDGAPYRGHEPRTQEERFWQALYEQEWVLRHLQRTEHVHELAWVRRRAQVWIIAATFGCVVNIASAVWRALWG